MTIHPVVKLDNHELGPFLDLIGEALRDNVPEDAKAKYGARLSAMLAALAGEAFYRGREYEKTNRK